MQNSKKNTSSKYESFKREFVYALRETSKYILSHHTPDKYYKCYHLSSQYVCARCLGIYLGILLGVFLSLPIITTKIIVVIFPMLTLLERYLHEYRGIKSHNYLRTFLGILLGFAFFSGIRLIYQDVTQLLFVGAVGIAYALLALLLILNKSPVSPA